MATEWGDNKEITYFGKTNFRSTDKVFGIKRKDRRQHMYILGKSGTGKSVLLSNLIIQNIKNGEGVCVIDPHGELVQEILASVPPERVKDTIYFNPGDIDYHVGFNVLELEDTNYKHLVASGIMGIFTKIWANAWSSRMEYILNNAILALLDTPGSTLLGIPRLLVDKDYRQTIITNLKDPVVRAFWVHEYEAWRDQFRNEAIAPIQNKVGQFLSTSIIRNVVGQSKSTIDIFSIMNSGKIFLVNVSKGRVGEDNSALLGGMIITKIQLAAMERVRIPEDQRKDFYLYVDEFQNFVTDSFANILSEARKYRLNLTIAHQYIGQLETETGAQVRDAVFGNVGTMIVFRVGATDADFLEKEFEPEFEPQDFVNLPNYHVYLKLMVDGIASRPFSASTLPPIKVEHSEEIVKKVVETSRALYMRPRKEVEDEITRWSSATGGKIEQNSMDGGRSPMSQGQTEGGRFEAKCSSCEKDIKVPFEPQPGRPVYCRDCLEKIKSGELQPVIVSGPKTKKMESQSSDTLAALGIEFNPSGTLSDSLKVERFHDEKHSINKTPIVPPKITKPVSGDVKKFQPPVRPPVNNAQTTTFTPQKVQPPRDSIRPQIPLQQPVPRPATPAPSPRPPVVQVPKPQPMSPAPRPQQPPPQPRPVVPIEKKKTADIVGLKSALQSALSNVGLGKEELKPKEKIALDSVSPVHRAVPDTAVPLASLKQQTSLRTPPVNTKIPTEKNMSALKDVLAAAMKGTNNESVVTTQTPTPSVVEESKKPFLHHEAKQELDDVDRLHQTFSERKSQPIIDEIQKKQADDLALAEEMKKKIELEQKEALELEQKKQIEIKEKEKQDREAFEKKQEEERILEEKRKIDEAEKQKRDEEARLIAEKQAADLAAVEEEQRRIDEEIRIKKELQEKAEREAREKVEQEIKEKEIREAKEREDMERKKQEEEEALRIVREKARQFEEEEARMKQEEQEAQSAQQTNSQQQTQSYTPRQPVAEVPEDVLKKILE